LSLGRIKGVLAEIDKLGRFRSFYLAGPQHLLAGWAALPSGWRPPFLAGPGSSLRLGRGPLSRPASPPSWAGVSYPAGPRPGPSASQRGPVFRLAFPGWALSQLPRLGRRPLLLPGQHPGGPATSPRPAGPDQEDPAWPGLSPSGRYFGTVPAGPGRDSLAQAGLLLPRPNYPSPGRDLLLPGHFHHSALTPASCASPGTPPGSDWHILHHYMLVLGRPLAQTSILHLS
jgi:hypothetical protein